MPQRDIFHETVKTALIKDGWDITHDPLYLTFGERDLFIDLAGEKLIGTQKDGQKIAVEIKSFTSESLVNDLKETIGQYQIYQSVLRRSRESDRTLYIAITEDAHAGIFSEPLGNIILLDYKINLIVFDKTREVITQWMDSV